MATEPNPNDPYDRDRLKDPIRTNIGERRSPVVFDNDLPDPELAEAPSSNSRIAMLVLGIAIALGLVFYGLNTTSTNQQNSATTPAPANSQKSAETSPPAAPPGMRDVTPRANSQPGTTTGSAPMQNPASAPANNADAPANSSK